MSIVLNLAILIICLSVMAHTGRWLLRRRGKYAPPTFSELEQILGEDDLFGNLRSHDLMCMAMRHKVYDREEAFERLRNVAEHKRAVAEGRWPFSDRAAESHT